MRFVDIDKVKKNLDENKPDWTAEDYAVACEGAEFYSSMEDFIAEHDDEIEMMMFAPELVPDEPTWIPCSERLPENDAKCLVYTSDKRVCMARWYGKYDEQGAWYIISDDVPKLYRIKNVPFWMPLPEPPEVMQDARE